MTVNIAIAVSEGLVMAADSLSQMSDEAGVVTCVHQSVEKITEIRGIPVAVMVNGVGELNRRTIISLIREFEFTEYTKKGSPIRGWSMSEFASNLHFHIKTAYERAYPPRPADGESDQGSLPPETRPPLGLVVGGYSPGNYFPELIEIEFPSGSWTRLLDGQGIEFIRFWGKTSAIDRLVFGYDQDRIEEALESLQLIEDIRSGKAPLPDGLDKTKFDEHYGKVSMPSSAFAADIDAMARFLRMDYRLRGMPLQEAVEFADYLGTTAIGFDKFCKGRPAVGGELDVLAIQADGLQWYKRKSFIREMARAREEAFADGGAAVSRSDVVTNPPPVPESQTKTAQEEEKRDTS